MSRSFVRAWATVATIMALVCFAFVQPMPEHAQGVGHEQTAMEFSVPWDGNVSETPPFVDSILTGKTFTPYLTIDASPQIHHGAPREFLPTEALLRLPTTPPEPLIRPG